MTSQTTRSCARYHYGVDAVRLRIARTSSDRFSPLATRLGEKDLSELRALMGDPLRQFNSDLIDVETVEALQTLPRRSESYVRWDRVLKFFETDHPALTPSLASLSDLRS